MKFTIDQYGSFIYKIIIDGKYVAGITKISGLTGNTVSVKPDVNNYRMPHLAPGQSSYNPIVLERGVTFDAEFEQWANKVWDYSNTKTAGETSLADFRKNITIEVYDVTGQIAESYNVYNCWTSEFIALPDLDGDSTAIAIQSLTLENEGWERSNSNINQAD